MNITSKGEKFFNCSYSLRAVSWNRASTGVLVAIPKDPRAPSMLQAGHPRLLQGQGVAAGALSLWEGRGCCDQHIWPTLHSCNKSPRIMGTQNLGASPTAGVSQHSHTDLYQWSGCPQALLHLFHLKLVGRQ